MCGVCTSDTAQGNFTDEFGVLHTGGPQYNLTHWEVLNEPEGLSLFHVACVLTLQDVMGLTPKATWTCTTRLCVDCAHAHH